MWLISPTHRSDDLAQGEMEERIECGAKYARGCVNWAIKMTLKTSALPPSLPLLPPPGDAAKNTVR